MPVPLVPVKFGDSEFTEDHLQTAIHACPSLLPVEEIDATFSPVISLGREIDNLDNLLISPSGRITIVETKLWRNPESTREVVAQILDYAVRVSGWTYEDLESNARRAMAPAPLREGSLYNYVCGAAQEPVLSEPEFIDAVQRTLSTGRFLLLIIGDGIRENIERMLGALHEYPRLLFTFGLVELRAFRSDGLPGKTLLVPQVLAKTTEVVRAVVKVQTEGTASVTVEMESAESEQGPARERRTLSEQEFFEALSNDEVRRVFANLLDFARELGAIPVWHARTVSLQLPDPGESVVMLHLFVLTTVGNVYPSYLGHRLNQLGLPSSILETLIGGLTRVFTGVTRTTA